MCLQMLVYVVVQLVEEFESEATKPDAQDMAVGGKVCYWYVLMNELFAPLCL